MNRNSTPETDCALLDTYNTSLYDTQIGNDSSNFHSELLNIFNCLNKELSVNDKAREIFARPVGILSFIVCCLSLLANITSILAISKMSPKKSMHLKLIISLCLSDSLISISVLSDDLLYIFTEWNSCTRFSKRLLLDLSLFATLLNLFVMAFDHYIAITKPIHYRQLITKFQMNCIVCGLWIVSLSVVMLEIFVGLALHADERNERKRQSFCEAIESAPDTLEIFIIGFIFVVLFGIMFIYLKIYSRVSIVMPHREVPRNQTDSGSFKALVTSLLFIGTFVFFWAPEGSYQIVLYVMSKTHKAYLAKHIERFTLINDVLFLVLQLNSLADTIIYAFRLPKVRSGCATLVLCRRKRIKKFESSLSTKQTFSLHCSSASKECKTESKNHEQMPMIEIMKNKIQVEDQIICIENAG